MTVLWRLLVHGSMRVYGWLLGVFTRLGPRTRQPSGPWHVLLTGTFHSDNWIRAHLGPLSASSSVGRITMVATTPLPQLDKVVAIYPPRWLRRVAGEIPARLLTFGAVALRTRETAQRGGRP